MIEQGIGLDDVEQLLDDAKELKTYIDNNLIVGSMPEHLQIFLNKISEE